MKKILLFCLAVGALLLSCNKEDVDELLLEVGPDKTQIIASSDEVITFLIKARSNNPLKNILITSREDNTVFYDTLLNKSLSGISYSSSYLYELDLLSKDTSLVFITFKVTEENGNSKSLAKRIINIREDKILTEKTGNIFYSHLEVSSLEDAYNLSDVKPEFSNLANPEALNIVDDTLATSSDELSRSWISLSGGKFRRDNGLDYVNATQQTLIDSFESGQAKDKITNLQDGDIIVFRNIKDGASQYYAIKIVKVTDKDGTDQDSYEFNYKF